MYRLSPVARASAAATGLLAGMSLGLLANDGRFLAVGAALFLAAALAASMRAMVPAADHRTVGAIVALSFVLHIAAATLMYTGSLAAGRDGFITGDDREYGSLSRAFATFLKGEPDPAMVPPYWGGSVYLFGTWVYVESAIFYVLGYEPLVPIFLNGFLALLTAVLASDVARRLFGARAGVVALVLVGFFPSLVVWTSLNLKDSLVLFLMAVVVWSLARFQLAPRWWLLALAFVPLVAMESLRPYIFVGLALLIPMAVVLSPGLARGPRARWTLAAIVASVAFLNLDRGGVGLGPGLIEQFEITRSYMAVGARTRFVELPTRPVSEGDTFMVAAAPTPAPRTVNVPANAIIFVATDPSATAPTSAPGGPPVVVVRPGDTVVVGSPSTTPGPVGDRQIISPSGTPVQAAQGKTFVVGTPTPSVVHVPLDARIVVATGTSAPPTDPNVVVVRPGDLVVVGSATTSAAPEYQRQVIPVGAPVTQLRSSDTPTEVIALRTLAHLPSGFAHVLFAPFPWQVARAVDAATIPDVLVWYVVLACAAMTVLRHRVRWRLLFVLAALPAGLLLLLALVEGNVGTLYRHRAMATPWVLILAAPTLLSVFDRIRPDRQARHRPVTPEVQ